MKIRDPRHEMKQKVQGGEPILDGYALHKPNIGGTGPVAFEPLIYEEYTGPCLTMESYSPSWMPIIEAACESTFRGFLGGEAASKGWFFETGGHFKHMKIVELRNKGTEAVISRINSADDDDISIVGFFEENWHNYIYENFSDESEIREVIKFVLTNRALIAEHFNSTLSERFMVLAGRFGSAANSPRMIEPDQLQFLTIVDWKSGIAKFNTGEMIYSLHAAYSDDLNISVAGSPGEQESKTLRARKTRAVALFLENTYPDGVPESVSGGALASQVAQWFKEKGFDDGVSDKTVYRVRRTYNSTKMVGS